MSGTDVAYGATRIPKATMESVLRLRESIRYQPPIRYAMSGTELAYHATSLVSGTELAYPDTRLLSGNQRAYHATRLAVSGTELAYGDTGSGGWRGMRG
eukprot:1269605-Rhodomonas_salina.1